MRGKKQNLSLFSDTKGITLIALVITIIVLLILAGISISMLSGENSILKNAQNAKAETEKSDVEEKVKLAVMGAYDSNGNFDSGNLKKELDNLSVTYNDEGTKLVIQMPNRNQIIVSKATGEITKNGEIAYTVEHYQMDISGNYPSTPTGRNKYTSGVSGENIILSSLKENYTGFTYKKGQVDGVDTTTTTILEDGSRVIKLYYERNKYTLTFDGNGGSTPTVINAYYGAAVTMPTSTRALFIFEGWYTTASGVEKVNYTTMPVNGATLYAGWKLTVGTEITLGGEQFFVIEDSTASNSNVKLLSKFNLDQEGTAQQNASYGTTACAFSSNQYWTGNSENLNKNSAPAGSAYQKAKAYGVDKGGTGRLMTYDEAIALQSANSNILYGKNIGTTDGALRYWLGTSHDSKGELGYVCRVGGFGSYIGYDNSDNGDGVRVVIEISKSKIS